MIEKRDFYIDGRWVAPLVRCDMPVVDPTSESAFATVTCGQPQDVDAAVRAARAAFPIWSATPSDLRLDLVRRVLTKYDERRVDLATTISREMGAPIDLAMSRQFGGGRRHISQFIDAFDGMVFEHQMSKDTPQDLILKQPIGVVGLITPWNWPLNQIALKCIAALLAGCTMVLKPSEITPQTAMIWTEILHDAGIPAGVFNLVTGDAETGASLVAHDDVDLVSFTGSTEAGVAISKSAAETVKRVVLEMGGKGANLIFADADVDAVRDGVIDCFANSGQSCNAPTRMFVDRSRYEAAIDSAAVTAEQTKVGPADATGDHIGPVASKEQFEKIQTLIQSGIDQGARLVAGGLGRPDGLTTGYYVRPTVFADVTADMDIARNEIFGPVLCMAPFDTEEDAIRMANDTRFGLTNYLQTADRDRQIRVARQLQSGMVEINGVSRGPAAPFGGMRQSGNGREGGIWGIEEFLEVRSISGWTVV
jgi:aldehyde dehydrogenase (NAD+)